MAMTFENGWASLPNPMSLPPKAATLVWEENPHRHPVIPHPTPLSHRPYSQRTPASGKPATGTGEGLPQPHPHHGAATKGPRVGIVGGGGTFRPNVGTGRRGNDGREKGEARGRGWGRVKGGRRPPAMPRTPSGAYANTIQRPQPCPPPRRSIFIFTSHGIVLVVLCLYGVVCS